MIDNNKVVAALRTVKDPRSGTDILTSKMIEDLRVSENEVNFSIVLKSNEQELKSALNFACIEAIQKVYPEAEVNVHLKLKSENLEVDRILPQITHVIAVGSGKGGVGKSTISVNLALTLQKQGFKVGILDADVYGPSLPTMLGLAGQRPKVEMLYGKHKIVPLNAYGMPVMSIGFIVDAEQAVVLRGPRLAGIIRQFLQECLWPELDFLIIDLPPGTGDVQLTLVQTIPVTGVVLVTTPQEVAVVDAVKAMNMFLLPNVNVPILGVVENMSWFTPAELPENKYLIFGQGGGLSLAEKAESILLGQVPLIQSVRESSDTGKPAVLEEDHLSISFFDAIATTFLSQLDKRIREKDPTHIVKMAT